MLENVFTELFLWSINTKNESLIIYNSLVLFQLEERIIFLQNLSQAMS